jgi:hypothetical protein
MDGPAVTKFAYDAPEAATSRRAVLAIAAGLITPGAIIGV